MKKVSRNWVGTGVCCEEVPVWELKNRKMTVDLCAWTYLFNLVGYVLRYISDLKSNKLLTKHPFIPDNEIYISTQVYVDVYVNLNINNTVESHQNIKNWAKS